MFNIFPRILHFQTSFNEFLCKDAVRSVVLRRFFSHMRIECDTWLRNTWLHSNKKKRPYRFWILLFLEITWKCCKIKENIHWNIYQIIINISLDLQHMLFFILNIPIELKILRFSRLFIAYTWMQLCCDAREKSSPRTILRCNITRLRIRITYLSFDKFFIYTYIWKNVMAFLCRNHIASDIQ